MLKKLFSKRPRPGKTPSASLPEGQRVYAIGDIHGRLDLLKQLVVTIEQDDAARPATQTTILFLGDLVDRGPESAQVVSYLMDLQRRSPVGRVRLLLGNHEEVFLSAATGDEKALRFFTKIGGRETILSYGISEERYDALDYAELLTEFQARVPAEHTDFISSFEDMLVLGDYVFVHAGIRPTEPLAAQKPKDLRWIREGFLDVTTPFEKVVVHGHTIVADVEELPNRIALDTGAYRSGKLTAMGFEADQRWVLSAIQK
ncbi:metallophosphoesterase family protein [Sphingomonas xinjiangensis]|uniref:Serine/threonine protein phosphatase 1 n=1 Tax=Sphingomonas xinjiangensis TaxID=643568 RepID=A0A840YM34_9SPHN|nr:metallophosphoesterase family protein [Sphingomonas xinjiangensis]MBB5710520.1 serine/threonine protein phosphatase 1 [Sphingomonas xinjiangensis]